MDGQKREIGPLEKRILQIEAGPAPASVSLDGMSESDIEALRVRYDAVKMAFDAGRETMDLLMSRTPDNFFVAGMLKAFDASHRTRQQGFVRAMVELLSEWGGYTGSDMRNEAAVKFAKELKQRELYFPFV